MVDVQLMLKRSKEALFPDVSSEKADQLHLLPPDMLLFITQQIILPIAAGCLSSLLYDKYKNIVSKEMAKEAVDDIQKALPSGKSVDQGTLTMSVTKTLEENGFSSDESNELALKIISLVREHCSEP